MALRKEPVPAYYRIAKDAWGIATRHYHLWIFGFFATFVGYGGVSEAVFGAYDWSIGAPPWLAGTGAPSIALLPGAATVLAIVQASAYPFLALTLLTAFSVLAFAVFAWIVTVSIGALIASVARIARGGDPTFPEAMQEGTKRFLPMLGVNILVRIVVWAAYLFSGAHLLTLLRHASAFDAVVYLLSFILFTAVAVIISVIGLYASNAVMLDGDDVVGALRRAGAMFTDHWLVSLEMTVLLFFVTLFIGLLAAFGGLVLLVPFVFFMLLAGVTGGTVLLIPLLTIAAVGLLIIVITLGSFVTTFQTAAWTLLYGELRKKRHKPHLAHWFETVFAK